MEGKTTIKEMLHFTQIARQSDALALAADTESGGNADPNIEKNKVAAKNLLRRLSSNSSNPQMNMNYGQNSVIPPGGGVGAPPVCLSVEAGNYIYHILIEGGVMFVTLCDATSPSSHAFAYLADVSREFLQQYANSIDSFTRPYACIKFDSYLQKTKKVFSSSHARGAAMSMPAGGRYPAPVKRLYREVMGIADPAGATGASGSRGNAPSSGNGIVGKGGKDNTLVVVGGIVAAIFALVLIILFFVLM